MTVAVYRGLEYPERMLTAETDDKHFQDQADFEEKASDEFNLNVLLSSGNTS